MAETMKETSRSRHGANSRSDAYAKSGVDVTAGYRAIDMMRGHIQRTMIPGVVGGVGGFGGLFDLGDGRLLASGADGVGTKLKLAILADKHDTVGVDCVAMNVNDIVCCGAKPLFFLDYIASGRTDPERVERIISGVADGCVQAGCALLGGETAEMPGFYGENEYDLAGFAVGIMDAERRLPSEEMEAGDVLIALPSNGVHSNGFSLIRQVLPEETLLSDSALLDELLTPTRIYVRAMTALMDAVDGVRAAAHITGGGWYENLPRALKAGLSLKIDLARLQTPPIFHRIQEIGGVSDRDMFNTFNMGMGMGVIVSQGAADKAIEVLRANGVAAYALGEVVRGGGEIII
ncbi:MAG: phosphoribosylformylglycinamidine cyclo-ligase [Oscillospiraceae bacterium]|jgi:phosphoribosylformylglycinamidine cyclo-ligase|nr:phosphoribosylformylglycinamidine cyclo-ligase [Oscillospiraceae bacterium]